MTMHKNIKDITGNQYNRLTVLKFSHIRGGHAYWLCRCDCGNEITTKSASLTQENTKSCGCLKHDLNLQTKKKNKYDLSGSFGIGYTENSLAFYFDLEDYEKISSLYWNYHSGYIAASQNNGRVAMHRLILNHPHNMVIDHINHITHDNRKENLRICTSHQNVCNKKIAKNNTSGIKGVCKEKDKWHSYIFFNGKTIHLGRFINIEDAIISRQQAEELYFGEYTYNPK